eukprot:TRINITY_DN16482_c0_g1_i1.p1 TRINITY_DN16482_c0_g1~~TRINITY_DN16482_c0_g1_i1.p1  ORF type:complete len:1276 (+),score=403.32 TRINITY_DN16482_c0_g1_i1:48-3875(+)
MELDMDTESDGAWEEEEAFEDRDADAEPECPFRTVVECVAAKQQMEQQLKRQKDELNRDVLRLTGEQVEDRQIAIEETEDAIARHGRWQIALQKETFFKMRARLPIMEKREEIVGALAENRVVIITGTTGCGKSTQVPQLVYDSTVSQYNRPKPVLVAQTRRIATTSIAARVALERGEALGKSVGFTIGGCNAVGRRSELQMHFVTMGVLMAMLTSGDTLRHYSHVVLDEVHERTLEIDTALAILRKLMSGANKRVKLVIMSATMDTMRHRLQDYFQDVNEGSQLPVIGVRVAENYKVHYLDSPLVEMTPQERLALKRPPRKAKLTEERKVYAVRLIETLHHDTLADGAGILVFLPGLGEMTELFSRLERVLDMATVQLLCLHSTVSIEEQARVFKECPGKRMIVLSTSIAESSLTVKNLGVVIDFCLHKENEHDQKTNISQLTLRWASRAMCVQRAGRCGRQFAGQVHRIVSHAEYQAFDDAALPEITTAPLQNTCLKVLNMRCIEDSTLADFLMDFLDPPSSSQAISSALDGLVALRLVVETAVRYRLTYFGKLAALLSVDVSTAVLILHGYMYGCLKDTLVLAAMRSRSRRVILQPFRQPMLGAMLDLGYAGPCLSDDIASINAYYFWVKRAPKGPEEEEWCARRGLSLNGLREVRDAVLQLTTAGSKVGLCEPPHAAEKGRQLEAKLRSVELLAASDVDEAASLAVSHQHALAAEPLSSRVLTDMTLSAGNASCGGRLDPGVRRAQRALERSYAAKDELLLAWLLDDSLREIDGVPGAQLRPGEQFALTACLAAGSLQQTFLIGHAAHEGDAPISAASGQTLGEFYVGLELSHDVDDPAEVAAARENPATPGIDPDTAWSAPLQKGLTVVENQLRVLRSLERAQYNADGARQLKAAKVSGEPVLPIRMLVMRPRCKRVELYLRSAAVGDESAQGWFNQAGYQRVYALRVASRLVERRIALPDALRAREAVKTATRDRDGKLKLPGRAAFTYLKTNVIAVAKARPHTTVAAAGVMTYINGPNRLHVHSHHSSIAFPFVLLKEHHVGFGIPARLGGRKKHLRMEAGTMVVGCAGMPELLTLASDPSAEIANVTGEAESGKVKVEYVTRRNGVPKLVVVEMRRDVLREVANLREVGTVRLRNLHEAYVAHLKRMHEKNMARREKKDAFDMGFVAPNTWDNPLHAYAEATPGTGMEAEDAAVHEEDEAGIIRAKPGFAAQPQEWDEEALDRTARAATVHLGKACEPRADNDSLRLPKPKYTLASMEDHTLELSAM